MANARRNLVQVPLGLLPHLLRISIVMASNEKKIIYRAYFIRSNAKYVSIMRGIVNVILHNE